jgi:hypothetical protein
MAMQTVSEVKATPTPSNVFQAAGIKKEKNKDAIYEADPGYIGFMDINKDKKIDEVEAKFYLWYFDADITKEDKQKYPITEADRKHFIALCEDGLKRALELKSPDNSFELDERSYSLCESASNFAEAGLYDKAIEIAHMNRDKELKGSAIRNICVIMADNGHYDRATKLALTNKYKPERSASLGVIAFRKAEHVSLDEGLKFLADHHIEPFYVSGALGDIYDLMIGRGMKEPEIETVFKNYGYKVSDKDKFVVKASEHQPHVKPNKKYFRSNRIR